MMVLWAWKDSIWSLRVYFRSVLWLHVKKYNTILTGNNVVEVNDNKVINLSEVRNAMANNILTSVYTSEEMLVAA